MNFLKRIAGLSLIAFAAILYFPLNQILTSGYNLQTVLDQYIPVIPIFTIPYLMFLPFWIFAFLYAAWKMDDPLFRSLIAGSFAAISIMTLIYVLFPTYTDRPAILNSGWTDQLLRLLYSHDDVFNAFPSGHVLYTTLIAMFGSHWHPQWSRWLNGSVVLVIASTLFTGQHHLVDPLGGYILAWAGYRVGLWFEAYMYPVANQATTLVKTSNAMVRVRVD